MSGIDGGGIHSGAADPVLEDVIAEITDRLQAGDLVDLAEYQARHPEHAEELRRLLPALEMMAQLGSSPARPEARGGHARSEVSGEAKVLGDYRLIRELGRGGMGIVYEAEQLSLGRRVALKVLPFAATMEPRQLQRFRVEAQAAACLHHPNIVPVFGVGCERGVHYYAMQLIEGQSLAATIRDLRRLEGLDQPDGPPAPGESTSPAEALRSGAFDPTPLVPGAGAAPPTPGGPLASDETVTMPAAPGAAPGRRPNDAPTPSTPTPGTSTRDRAYIRSVARLGRQAAEALDHAHQRGILHRDVKPANLLLDPAGQLWVADFGLARFLDDASLTITGDLLGTLRYMSPEQAMAKRVVIDHRTDVYSLGVTLYELLTLCPAIEGGDRAQVLRRIAEQEPTPLRQLNPAVPRDLETIVNRAMAKEAADRYATAGELAEDLQRFLDGQTIRARRPSLLDRASKLALRHRAIAASAVLTLILAVIGLAVSNRLIRRERGIAQESAQTARRETGRAEAELAAAEAVSDFLRNHLLAQANPEDEPDRDIRLRTVLDRAADTIGGQFDGQPRVEVVIRIAIGEAYESLGLYEKSRTHLERAHELANRTLGAEHFHTLDAKHALAALCLSQGRYTDAEPLLVAALEAYGRLRGVEDPRTLNTTNSLAMLYKAMGRSSEAEPLLVRVLEAQGRLRGAEDIETLNTMANLASVYHDGRKWSEAEPLLIRALEAQRRLLTVDHPRTQVTMRDLAALYLDQGRTTEAEPLFVEALEAQRRVLSEDHPYTLATMVGLARVYIAQDNWSEAERVVLRVLEGQRRLLGEEHPETLSTRVGLADIYMDQGKWSEAEPLLVRVLEAQRRSPVHDDIRLSGALAFLGDVLLKQEKFAEAEPLLREASVIREAVMPDDWRLFKSRSLLGGSLAGRGAYEEAEPLLLDGYEGMKAREASITHAAEANMTEAAERLAGLYEGWGKPDEAARWREVASHRQEPPDPK